MRRAKVVATIGPASSSAEVVHALLELGVDVARLNFSHGSHDEHADVIDLVRRSSRKLGRFVSILADLQGPKIRTGPLAAGKDGVPLVAGGEIVITTEDGVVGDEHLVSTTYRHLAEDVHSGDHLLVDDGLITLCVLETDGVRARCRVEDGGLLKPNKGINLPGVKLRASALSEKDKRDLAFGLAHGVDWVALSFVRTADDVELCRAEMRNFGRVVPIVAKIEKPEAMEYIDGILASADALMIARGDLGVEIPLERVPNVQKEILRKANAAGKPVIVATQMLESMIDHPRPTRAEASDVANAIWDGADAVMLSGESAAGRYPAAAVRVMDRIVREAELHLPARAPPPVRRADEEASPFPVVVASAAVRAAHEAHAVAVTCFTRSGDTARLLAQYRPSVPVVAFSPDEATARLMSLYWGIVPRIMEPVRHPDEMCELVAESLVAARLAAPGDRVAVVYGSPMGVARRTNSIRLYEIPLPANAGG
jgi:pyruvate kinase